MAKTINKRLKINVLGLFVVLLPIEIVPRVSTSPKSIVVIYVQLLRILFVIKDFNSRYFSSSKNLLLQKMIHCPLMIESYNTGIL